MIIIDEYAELTDDAPEAMADADSVARLGRAVAVSMIAATQRPTQKAMGQGAVRSQMDIRISFRVRERKDVDLIMGQGMLAAGWHAQTLDAPGKFLVSAAEHRTPRRARAYLLTDQAVAETTAQHSVLRPELDEVSRRAIEENELAGQPPPGTPEDVPAHFGAAEAVTDGPTGSDQGIDPEAILWAALSLAPDEGTSVPDLVTETSMSRRWVYYRLRELAAAGRAVQVTRGQWRAANPDGDHE